MAKRHSSDSSYVWTDTKPAGLKVTVFPVSPPQGRILSSSPFILWREEWMTQVQDEKRQACWWSLHNTQTDERGVEQLQSIFMSAGRWGMAGCRVFPGFQSDAIPAPQVSLKYRQNPIMHFSSNIWGWG